MTYLDPETMYGDNVVVIARSEYEKLCEIREEMMFLYGAGIKNTEVYAVAMKNMKGSLT